MRPLPGALIDERVLGTMPRGDKTKYTDKQIRKADHITESYEARGVPRQRTVRQRSVQLWPRKPLPLTGGTLCLEHEDILIAFILHTVP